MVLLLLWYYFGIFMNGIIMVHYGIVLFKGQSYVGTAPGAHEFSMVHNILFPKV